MTNHNIYYGKSGTTIELTNTSVIIKRRTGFKSILNIQHNKGDKVIPLSSISSVQLKLPNMLTNGYIQFAYPGSIENKKGVWDAVHDENSVMFNKNQINNFIKLRDEIIARKSSLENSNNSSPTKAQEIAELNKLRQQGILTDIEFKSAKEKILS